MPDMDKALRCTRCGHVQLPDMKPTTPKAEQVSRRVCMVCGWKTELRPLKHHERRAWRRAAQAGEDPAAAVKGTATHRFH